MIAKRKNPNASRTNMLKITELDGLCCGDDVRDILCKYSLTIDVTSVTTASLISLGGTEYDFGVSVDTATSAGQALLKEKIKDALHQAGYTTDGVELSQTGDNLTISTGLSQLEFDYLEGSGNAFTKTICEAVGPLNVSACIAEVPYEDDGTYFILKPVAGNEITNVTVNDGGGDDFDGALSYEDGSPAGNSSTANGFIYLDITGLGYTGATTFTVTITSKGCDDIVKTINYTFA